MKLFLLLVNLFAGFAFAQTFKGESVEYDPTGNRYLTSDNGTSIVQRESNGTISYFGQGLLADYGMEVVGNTLFTISGTKIYGYDLTTATQVAAINISGASFLNGLASDSTHLWVTDFSGGSVSAVDISNLASPVVSTIVPVYGGTPNGIVHDKANNRLVVVSWGANAKIKAIDLSNNAVSTLTTTTLTNIDGITMDNQGNFYIASWSPDKIVKYNNDFTQSLDISVAGLNNPADICYALAKDTLAIPNTGGNNILFVGFQTTISVDNQDIKTHSLTISPNPISEKSMIQIEASMASNATYTISDIKGQILYTSPQMMTKVGKNDFPFPNIALAQGFYYCTVRVNDKSVFTKFFKGL